MHENLTRSVGIRTWDKNKKYDAGKGFILVGNIKISIWYICITY